MSAKRYLAMAHGQLPAGLALDDDGESTESDDGNERHHGGADDARAECAAAAMALLGAGASQPARDGDLGHPGSENSGEGGVVSGPVMLEDDSVRRSVERGGRIHDQRGQARCAQPARELLRVVGDCSNHRFAWAYADRDSNVIADGTELRGGARHGRLWGREDEVF